MGARVTWRRPTGALTVDWPCRRNWAGRAGWRRTPEQLFAAGYAACFDNAMIRVARGDEAVAGRIPGWTARRRGSARSRAGRFQLAVELLVTLPGRWRTRRKARAVLDAAHQVCPYSNATRGNIDVSVTLVPAPDVD